MLFKKRRQEKEYPHIRDIENNCSLNYFSGEGINVESLFFIYYT